jgi:hypothetical protein
MGIVHQRMRVLLCKNSIGFGTVKQNLNQHTHDYTDTQVIIDLTTYRPYQKNIYAHND